MVALLIKHVTIAKLIRVTHIEELLAPQADRVRVSDIHHCVFLHSLISVRKRTMFRGRALSL